jgi:stage II sporulation protein D
MALTFRRSLVLTLCILPLALVIMLRHRGGPASAAAAVSSNAPKIRVRLLTAVDTVTLTCNAPPLYQFSNQSTAQKLNSPANAVFSLTLAPDGWHAGNAHLAGVGAVLHVQPERDGAVSINGVPYRGKFRFVPAAGGGNKFDVINDVEIDAYLAGVVGKECLPAWHEQTYRAQAIVARTYALYEKQTAGPEKSWDVYPDTRSQSYGGIPAESAKSRAAVADTAGVVVAAPDATGQPHIFKAYFSSSCGGVSLSAADAFGSAYLPALSDQDQHAACRASPRFSWGPLVIDKMELTRRFTAFGRRLNRPEQNIGTITRIDIQDTNRFGRPTRFLVTDSRQNKFSLIAEEFRWAVNTAAVNENNTLFSSYVKVINDSDKIRFVEGHGWGHGVGLCQWSAEKRAEDGIRHEDIILAAYPTAVLVRAY